MNKMKVEEKVDLDHQPITVWAERRDERKKKKKKGKRKKCTPKRRR